MRAIISRNGVPLIEAIISRDAADEFCRQGYTVEVVGVKTVVRQDAGKKPKLQRARRKSRR